MPTLVKTERLSSIHQKLSFTFDDLNLLDPKLDFTTTITDTILKGKWTLDVYAVSGPLKGANFLITFSGAAKGSFGTNIYATAELAWITEDGSTHNTLEKFPWPLAPSLPQPQWTGYRTTVEYASLEEAANATQSRFKPATHRRYLFHFELRSAACPDTKALAQSRESFYTSPLPNDLRFFFPQPGGGLELWSRADSLPSELRDLLETADFVSATGIVRSTRNARLAAAIPHWKLNVSEDEGETDSDDEADSVYASALPTASAQKVDLPTPNSFRQIDVQGASYSTFKALLVYLDTSYIRFSPLKSFFSSSLPPTTRRSYLGKSLADEPHLPLPVSPKSIYRLASFLDLEPLKELALSTLKSSLLVSNAAEELFSPLSLGDEEVQKMIIEYVGQNWTAIRDGQSYKDIVAKIKRDEIKGAGKVLVDLIVAVQGN